MTVVAGDMLLPLGTYTERSAGWLNKIPDDPLPREVLPGSGVGAQLRGAIPVGQSGQMFTYSAYGVNGPGSVDGSRQLQHARPRRQRGAQPRLSATLASIQRQYWQLTLDPSGGGRIGWFYPLEASL